MGTRLRCISRLMSIVLILSMLVGVFSVSGLTVSASEIGADEDTTETLDTPFADTLEIEETKSIESTTDYILRNINPKYAKADKLEANDAILVKQTFAQKSKIPNGVYTIDNLWKRDVNGDWANIDAIITMNSANILMYDTDENSDYFVAYINPMVKDSNIETAEVVFAKNNLDGETYSDCIYDSKTGLAYIPKKYTAEAEAYAIRDEDIDEDGQIKEGAEYVWTKGVMFQSQVQLLQLVQDKNEKANTNVEIISKGYSEISVKGSSQTGILDPYTAINITDDKELAKEISEEDIFVYIDGSDIPCEKFTYSEETGSIVIDIPPSTLDSVKVDIKKTAFFDKLLEKVGKFINPVVHAKSFFNGKLTAPSSSILPYTWTFEGTSRDLRALKGKTIKKKAGKGAKNFKVFVLNPMYMLNESDDRVAANRIDPKYRRYPFQAQTATSTMAMTPIYTFAWNINSIETLSGGTTAGRDEALVNRNGTFVKNQFKLGSYIWGKELGDSKDNVTMPSLKSVEANLGAGSDKEMTTLTYYGVGIPNAFDLTDPKNEENSLEFTSAPTEGRSKDEVGSVTDWNTNSLLLPMICAHIESPLGIAPLDGMNYTSSFALKIMDYEYDDEDDKGYGLVGIISQMATGDGSVTGSQIDAKGNYGQTLLGVFIIPLKGNNPEYFVKFRKRCTDLNLEGTPGYETSGIKFGIYDEANDDTQITSRTTQADGYTKPIELEPGTYYYKELSIPATSLFAPPDGTFHKFIVEDTYSGVNDGSTKEKAISFTVNNPPKHFNLNISKQSQDEPNTAGNRLYTLQGIELGVYTNAECTTLATDYTGAPATVTLDANGNAPALKMLFNNYWVKEINAHTSQTGYDKTEQTVPITTVTKGDDGSITSVLVENGASLSANIADPPVHDPIKLQKHDNNTNKTTPQGDAKIGPVTYSLEYWDVQQDSVPAGTPKYSWVFRSNDNGFINFVDAAYYVSGNHNLLDWLMRDGSGRREIDYPVGTYVIRETKAPAGYKINPTPTIVRLVSTDKTIPGDALSRTYVDTYINGVYQPNGTDIIVEYKDPVIRGGVEVTLRDIEYPKEVRSQGDGTLEGAVFGIYSQSTNPVTVGSNATVNAAVANGSYSRANDLEAGYTISPTEHAAVASPTDESAPIMTITTNKWGYATTGRFALPVGRYTIRQLSAPEGYSRTGVSKKENVKTVYTDTFVIGPKDIDNGLLGPGEESDHGKMITVKNAYNPTIRGGVEMIKEDIELLSTRVALGNIDPTLSVNIDNSGLADIEFTIWNISSKNPDPDGAPKSNLVNAYVDKTFQKAENFVAETYMDGDVVVADMTGKDMLTLGKEVLKRQGATSNTTWTDLTGAMSEGYVTTIKTAWDEERQKYIARTYADEWYGALPYGTYLIAETKTSPSGKYILSDRSVFTFVVREADTVKTGYATDKVGGAITSTYTAVNGGITNVTDPTTNMSNTDKTINQAYKELDKASANIPFTRDGSLTSYNRVKRTDISLKKKADDSSNTLQVAFLLTNNLTGESHVLVMNKNGQFASHIETGGYQYSGDERDILYPEHTRRTNANDALYFATNEDGTIDYNTVIYDQANPIKVEDFDTSAGVWFGILENGYMSIPNDALCALPWGEYTLEELRCDTNIDYKLSTETLTLTNYKVDPTKEVSLSSKDDILKIPPTIRKTIVTKFDKEKVVPVENVEALLKTNEVYKYRLYVTAPDSDINGIVLSDMIEQKGTEKIGAIVGVDTSFAEKMGFGSKVVYTESKTPTADTWVNHVSDNTLGVMVSLDGVLKRGDTTYVEVLMKAPSDVKEHMVADNEYVLEAYNYIIYHNNDKEPNDPENPDNYSLDKGTPIISNPTEVEIAPLSSSNPSLKKTVVKGDEEGEKATLSTSEAYKYRLYVQANTNDIKDIILTDFIEQHGTAKLGYIMGVDTGYATNQGFTPSVAYTTSSNPNEAKWTSSHANAMGVVIQLHGILKAGDTTYVDILMSAPFVTSKQVAKNVYTLNYTNIYADGTEEKAPPIESNPTEVVIEPGVDPSIEKQIIKDDYVGNKRKLEALDTYIYRLNINAGSLDIKNMLVTDFIERAGTEQVGTIISVDTSDIINKGLVPTVLYTTNAKAADGKDWGATLTDKTVGIMVRLNGTLKANTTTYIDVLMKAPQVDKKKKAKNEFDLQEYTTVNPDNSEQPGQPIKSNETEVTITPVKPPTIKKEVITESGKKGKSAKLTSSEQYAYRLYVTAGEYDMSHIVITDLVEKAGSTVLGTITGVDTKAAKDYGFKVDVKYSTDAKGKSWDQSTPKSAKAVKFTLTGTTLKAKDSIYVDILMVAPEGTTAIKANNDFEMGHKKYIKNGDDVPMDPIKSNETTVEIDPNAPAPVNPGDPSSPTGSSARNLPRTGDNVLPIIILISTLGVLAGGIIIGIKRKKK